MEDIVYQVGRTGAITPVANLKAVEISGTIVKRASVHNADQIEKLDLRINDTVFVEKGELSLKLPELIFLKEMPIVINLFFLLNVQNVNLNLLEIKEKPITIV